MTRGIDLFRIYQTVTDWQAVKRAGIAFAWIKATNGTSVARDNSGNLAPADPTVAGARAAGIAPGLYHYALPGDPIRQADVFADEVIRLECLGPGTLPPALDLEEAGIGSTAQRRAFAVAFLRRLQARTRQTRVAIYASASWMADLQPEAWDIDGLIIWTAAYGSNDGARHGGAIASAGYRGRTDVHQYTSAGSCPGVQSEGLDVNEADIPLSQLLGGDDDMSWDDKITTWAGEELPARDVLRSAQGFAATIYNLFAPGGDPFGADLFTDNPGTEHERVMRLRDVLGEIRANAAAAAAAGPVVLAAVTKDPGLTEDRLRELINDAVAQHVQITGTVQIGAVLPRPAPAPANPASTTDTNGAPSA